MTSFIVPVLVIAVLVVLYIVFDRRRYHGNRAAGLRPTKEVFRDPGTGRLMRVYEDPQTGAREYRAE